jgi:hypothetical protein
MLNIMNSLDKNNGSLTKEKIVREIWTRTIGSFWNIWIQEQKRGGYKQPLDESHKEDTKKQIEKFVKEQ